MTEPVSCPCNKCLAGTFLGADLGGLRLFLVTLPRELSEVLRCVSSENSQLSDGRA
jgi:hypothetical protein